MPRSDDVIVTGSTMLKCATLLRELGAVSVWAYVTHGQFTQVPRCCQTRADRAWTRMVLLSGLADS